MTRYPLAFIAALIWSGVTVAAMPGDPPPPNLPTPHVELPGNQPVRVVPITSYTLALIWTPQHCFHTVGGAESLECNRDTGTRFVLHGLWPDGEGKSWPQWCAAADILPRKVIAAHYWATPSPQLMQHEWAKHGTCMTTKPELYFDLSRTLYSQIRYPDMAALAKRTSLTVGNFANAFAAANRGISADMLRVTTTRGGWLDEVWLCMDKAMDYTRCPTHQGGAANAARLRIKPGPRIANRPSPNLTKRKPALILDLDPNAQP